MSAAEGAGILASFIITLRETLEAALIVGIVLSYLIKTGQSKYNRIVYAGVVSAVLASIAGAFIFNAIAEELRESAEGLFEASIMIIGAVLITTLILWMMQQRRITVEIKRKVRKQVAESHKKGLFLLVFVAVLREGIETVIFLGAISVTAAGISVLGAALGIATAVLIGYGIFVAAMHIDINKFLTYTGAILVLFAAGLVTNSVHEFQEVGVLPTYIEHLWDINPPVNPDGSYPVLHEKGAIGSMLQGLFGYDGNPSLLMVISYFAYITIVAFLWKRACQKSV